MDSIRRVAEAQEEEGRDESRSETGSTDYESATSSPRNTRQAEVAALPEDVGNTAEEDSNHEQDYMDAPPPFVTDGRGRVIGANSELVEDAQGRTLINRVINVFSNIM